MLIPSLLHSSADKQAVRLSGVSLSVMRRVGGEEKGHGGGGEEGRVDHQIMQSEFESRDRNSQSKV